MKKSGKDMDGKRELGNEQALEPAGNGLIFTWPSPKGPNPSLLIKGTLTAETDCIVTCNHPVLNPNEPRCYIVTNLDRISVSGA